MRHRLTKDHQIVRKDLWLLNLVLVLVLVLDELKSVLFQYKEQRLYLLELTLDILLHQDSL